MPNTTQSIDVYLRSLGSRERDERASRALMPGGVAAAVNGLTFGFGDEIVAGARSLVGTPYREALGQERASRERYTERNPWTAAGLEMAGSAPTLLIPFAGGANATRAGAQALTAGGRAARAARVGATAGGAGGALQGAGEAESNLGMIPGAAVGGGVGAGLGAAGGAAVEAAAPLFRMARDAVTGVAQPEAAALRSLTRFVEGDHPLPGAGPAAVAQGARDEVGQQAVGLPPTGRTLAEMSGFNTRGAAEGLASMPGEAAGRIAPQMEQRAATRAGRIDQALEQTFGNVQEAFASRQELYRQRSADAGPLYDEVRRMTDVPLGEVEARLWARAQPAAADARTVATLRGENIPGDGNAPLTVSALLQAKTGLDTLIERETRASGRMSAPAVEARRLRDEIVDRLEMLTRRQDGSSVYREARQAWAGPSANLEALELGQDLFKADPAEMRATLTRMSQPERDHFVQGAMNMLRGRLLDVRATGSANPINAIAGSPAQVQRLEVLTEALGLPAAQGRQRFDALARYLRTENEGVQTENAVLRNSATARRQAFQSQLAPAGLGAAVGAAGGYGTAAQTEQNPLVGLALGAGTGAIGARAIAGRQNAALARMLGETDPAQQRLIAARIAALQQIEQRRQRGVPDRLAGQAGLIFGTGPGADDLRRGLLD